ncbi:hypothetical protein J2X56_000906 [Herbaspirillum sp. 1173]|uniref:hypothetical protein n=1 Tax=Herbaspirillum sp. 1173 TaxID=2817734 RepID=UPI00285CF679|nr:hypothetical protein [Herbaspirillum sp. 1173]MDR6738920.1 hypothetical protein [Herbaspirillum sp. 1173]
MDENNRELALAKKFRISNELADEVARSSEKFSAVVVTLAPLMKDPLMRDLRNIGVHVEHFIMDMQLAMVALEGCAEGSRLQRFAAARVIHSLYELKHAQRWFFKKVRDFAVSAGLAFDFGEIKLARVLICSQI